ncbi:MAG: aminotransferase class V-fold PLP-dependent enzyme [Flavobacteriia bacterium]|nr:aminotransferase class V-fold PLP-dependent enzyme [Flavobacteriia bacterium]
MIIDFRSDTVTVPSPEMKEFMFNAKVGDDVFGEDPTINELQLFSAAYFGKEDALFCSSGTQTNQIAINVHVRPGGEIICHEESHIYKYEGGGIAKNSGASVRLLPGDRGRLTAEIIAKWINPDDIHFPVTELVSLEDTANRGGGAVYDFEEIKKISALCKAHHLPLHLDGARLMNALAVNGISSKEYASQFDSISLCLSKGLGAPVGSLLIGTKDFIKKARRVRKVLGGGMRQAGFIAAGGLYALKNNVNRLKEDHENAKKLEESLLQCSWVKKILPVQTNIVVILIKNIEMRDEIISQLKSKGVLTVAFGEGAIRMVTHLNISRENILKTCEVLKNYIPSERF